MRPSDLGRELLLFAVSVLPNSATSTPRGRQRWRTGTVVPG